jgi:uncharacterized membrane protein
MSIDGEAVLAIAGMGAVTYACRCAGLWLSRRVAITARSKRVVAQLPAVLLISIIAPLIVSGGPSHAVAAAATALTALRSRSVLLAMAVGLATVLLLER